MPVPIDAHLDDVIRSQCRELLRKAVKIESRLGPTPTTSPAAEHLLSRGFRLVWNCFPALACAAADCAATESAAMRIGRSGERTELTFEASASARTGWAKPTTKMAARSRDIDVPVSYTHLRAHETVLDLVCRL